MVETPRATGIPPLTARLEPWMDELLAAPEECAQLIEQYGSPINVHDFSALAWNVGELRSIAAKHDVRFEVYIARKANKTLGLVEAARDAGTGVDVASKRELEQCLELGISGSRIIMSAATKTPAAIDSALRAGAVISVDNEDELTLVDVRSRKLGLEAQIALRIAISDDTVAPTRFGLPSGEWLRALARLGPAEQVRIRGVHFHLNGYSSYERVIGLREATEFVDALRERAHNPEFVDIGGGMPMSYLEDPAQWQKFWDAVDAGVAQRPTDTVRLDMLPESLDTLPTSCWGLPIDGVGPTAAAEPPAETGPSSGSEDATPGSLAGFAAPGGTQAGDKGRQSNGSFTPDLPEQAPLAEQPTWRGDKLGLNAPGTDRPSPATYPYYQKITRGEWLKYIITAPGITVGRTIADELRTRNLELRCEPGRAILDGCGMTIAQVAFRKTTSDGIPLVGLFMNRTQVRSTSADFLVDPILLRPAAAGEPRPMRGAYLVGSYCIEEELILRRAIDFPDGVAVGDLVAFPNTGGYLMHILESASHQLPLAANLVRNEAAASATQEAPHDALAVWQQDGVDSISPAGGERLTS